jgi:hypothetical protein
MMPIWPAGARQISMRHERQQMDETVCYCFNYTVGDIQRDVREHGGRSLILEEIIAQKKKGVCQCAVRHPEGR